VKIIFETYFVVGLAPRNVALKTITLGWLKAKTPSFSDEQMRSLNRATKVQGLRPTNLCVALPPAAPKATSSCPIGQLDVASDSATIQKSVSTKAT
jgi:hypothetical protein